MNDLVAADFELVENFGQREDSAGVNVAQLLSKRTFRLSDGRTWSPNQNPGDVLFPVATMPGRF
jgi:hypothetical protein